MKKPQSDAGQTRERTQIGYEHTIIAGAGKALEHLRRNAREAGWGMDEFEERIGRIEAGERAIAEHEQSAASRE